MWCDSHVNAPLQEQRQRVLRLILKQARLDRGLLQADLAPLLGQSQSFVSKYESGERNLTLIEVEQICNACQLSLLDLIGRYLEAVVNES